MISLIVAASTNNVIGADGGLPWRLSDDLKRFKAVTMGKPIIMGRLTWESIGRPLPGRQNIVVTRQTGYRAEGCDVVASVDEALEAAGAAPEVMVIGGGDVYRQLLPQAGRVYLTRVEAEVDGDTYFPELDEANWELVASEAHEADEKNAYAYTFMTFERRAACVSLPGRPGRRSRRYRR